MKRRLLLLGLFLCGRPELGFTQAWARTYGGDGVDAAYALQVTPDGGIVVAGYTDSFGAGGLDAWVLRLRADGSIVWQKTFGGGGSDVAYAVQPLADGGFIVGGYTGFPGPGDVAAWVFRLRGDGGLVWQRTYGPGVVYDLRPTADGGFVAVGTTSAFGAGGLDAWVLRLDAGGNVVWQKRYGGSGTDVGYSVRVLPDGGFVVAGFTSSFGVGIYDAWVLRLDAGGDVLWQRTYGGPLQDWADSVDGTPDGGFVVVGYTESFGAGRNDVWVLRLDPAGNVQWTATYGGAADDYAYAVRVLPDGGFVVAGFTTSFGAVYLGDFWVLRLRADGEVLWQRRYGGVSYDWAYAVQATADGGIVVAGMSQSFNRLNRDVWVLRTDGSGLLGGPCPWVHDTAAEVRHDAVSVVATGAAAVDTAGVASPSSAQGTDSGGVVHLQCPVSPDFSIECQPTLLVASPRRPGVSLCTVQSLNGFQGSVELTCPDAPSGVICGFVPNPVLSPADGSVTSRLTVEVRANVEEGSYVLRLRGTSGRQVRETTLRVEVGSRRWLDLEPPPRSRRPVP